MQNTNIWDKVTTDSITPEMLEAGVDALLAADDPNFRDDECLVRGIFTAMQKARAIKAEE